MRKKIKDLILQSYQQYHTTDFISTDPLSVVHRFKSTIDLEVVALFSALLSYGRVQLIIKAIEEILLICDNQPHNYALSTSYEQKLEHFASFKYRFNPGTDIAMLLEVYRTIVTKHGSINTFLQAIVDDGNSEFSQTLHCFSTTIKEMAQEIDPTVTKSFMTLFPTPQKGSACKRLCMLFRWMVREDDGIDLNQWNALSPSQLVIPLDTHIASVSTELGLTKRKSPDWKCAVEITRELRKLDKTDPIKYDFALCRVGMLKE